MTCVFVNLFTWRAGEALISVSQLPSVGGGELCVE